MTADRSAFLANRQAGLGSSDAAAIIGIGYKTPHQVYLSKVLPPDERPPAGVLARGIALEPHVARMYAEATGIQMLATPAQISHPDRPWQTANVDLLDAAGGEFAELKTTLGFGDGWGPAGTDEVPPDYWVQVQHQLGVAGRPVADLAALDVATWELRVYRIAFDPAAFDYLTGVQERFWFGHVVPRVPPPVDWLRQFEAAPPPLPVKGKAVELGDEAAALAARRADVSDVLKEAKAEYDRLTFELAALMGDAGSATAPGWKFSRYTVTQEAATIQRAASQSTQLRATAVKPKAVRGG